MAADVSCDGSDSPGICAGPLPTTDNARAGFVGTVIRYLDGSRWKLARTISTLKYQQGEPPFEARQVFEAVCVEDSHDAYSSTEKAVVKVKYQIRGTAETLAILDAHDAKDHKNLATATAREHQCLLDSIQYGDTLRYIATNPVELPHQYTFDEIKGLRKFEKTQCAYTPHLLQVVGDWLPTGVDKEAMEGGFAVFMLMTKVPGEPLTYEMMKGKTTAERDEIRAAFKTAMMELLKRGFSIHDCGMRNILWDEEDKKCYIVDFEDYVDMDMDWSEDWEDSYYRNWELEEERYHYELGG